MSRDDEMNPANDAPPMQSRWPNGQNKVLLNSCCAPCSAAIMETMQNMDIALTVLFYNPNIHPLEEYERRKNENKRFAEKHGIPFIDADYDSDRWFELIKGLENEPERGARCTVCFDMRLEYAARYASAHGFPVFATSLSISRWKNLEQINECGNRAASVHPGISFWSVNWRKNGGTLRMHELSEQEKFYRQEYCGCAYSLCATNLRRITNEDKQISPVR